MTIDQLINLLVTITLVEMMAATGLGVTFGQLAGVAKSWRLVTKAALANYVAVPVVTVGLLLLFGGQPMVAAGFLILAVCPGAPFGPPCTAIAKGNVAVAVGLMVILAGSSALLAPVLLHFLLTKYPSAGRPHGGAPPRLEESRHRGGGSLEPSVGAIFVTLKKKPRPRAWPTHSRAF
jgi:predicted Na+-dependent transporter